MYSRLLRGRRPLIVIWFCTLLVSFSRFKIRFRVATTKFEWEIAIIPFMASGNDIVSLSVVLLAFNFLSTLTQLTTFAG